MAKVIAAVHLMQPYFLFKIWLEMYLTCVLCVCEKVDECIFVEKFCLTYISGPSDGVWRRIGVNETFEINVISLFDVGCIQTSAHA